MPKFSLIVPVYDTEKYLHKCLNSIQNQTFKDYEVIIVNDGSTDNSQKIIDEYKEFKSFKKTNGGLSSARNYGVLKSKGEYLLFIDSDDYIDHKLLEEINNNLKEKFDLIRFQAIRISNHEEEYLPCKSFSMLGGKEAFLNIYPSNSLEIAPLYVYNKKFFIDNNFEFSLNKYHEDFGLIPLVVLTAKKVKSISYKGYYYVERPESITTSKSYETIKKRTFDMLDHFDFLLKESRKLKIDKNIKIIFESYLANSLITKIEDLNGIDKKNYIKELKVRKIIDLIMNDNIKRKTKKIMLKLKYKL